MGDATERSSGSRLSRSRSRSRRPRSRSSRARSPREPRVGARGRARGRRKRPPEPAAPLPRRSSARSFRRTPVSASLWTRPRRARRASTRSSPTASPARARALDPRLLDLLRALAKLHETSPGAAPRIELVSGFRSPKLNEMMRKKGHHVASHSQHSLGHAVDFRVVVACGAEPASASAQECASGATGVALDPRLLAREIRASGWDGGVGVYTSKDDWFVHADIGPKPETGSRGRAVTRAAER